MEYSYNQELSESRLQVHLKIKLSIFLYLPCDGLGLKVTTNYFGHCKRTEGGNDGDAPELWPSTAMSSYTSMVPDELIPKAGNGA